MPVSNQMPAWIELPEERAWRAFFRAYKDQFRMPRHEDVYNAEFLLDIINGEAFTFADGKAVFRPVSKADAIYQYTQHTQPIDDADETSDHASEAAEAALALLIEQGVVELDGDNLTVPARFQVAT